MIYRKTGCVLLVAGQAKIKLGLGFADSHISILTETDASSPTISNVLRQEQSDRKTHPVHYASTTTNAVEMNHALFEQEAFAVFLLH